MLFNDRSIHNGEVTIYKDYGNGKKFVYSSNNVVVSGMGETLAEILSTEDTSIDYFLSRFQLGVSGASALQVSSTNELGGKLDKDGYGIDENIYFVKSLQKIGDREESEAYFISIDKANITLVGTDTVKLSLVVDKGVANGQSINEIGLFSQAFSTVDSEICNLVAYDFFPVITKESDYSLIFEWSLEL